MTYPEKLKSLLDYMFKLERENKVLRSVLMLTNKKKCVKTF
jgi:hypothetical protein